MIRLRTLGACVIHVGDTVVGPDAERLFAVLLYLVTERGRRTARRTIQDLLWPEAGEENGRHNLRQAIYKLRQLGAELGGGNRDVQLYADQIVYDPFDVLAGDAARAGDALLGGQLGEYLAGYSPTFSAPYAAWVEAQRAYAHARVARAAVAATLERRARGRWDDVERLAQICLGYDPLNEEATLALAESNALAGSKARALAILDQYIAELGDSTSIQLPATLLRRRIAERLPDPPYTVPSEACFVGRDESLRYLHELFGHARAGRGESCMVVGEPGVGKSRLVAEFARVATLQGALVQTLGSQPRDATRPLSLFVDGVPALLRLPGALGCAPRSMGYLKRITEFDPGAAPSADSREAEQLYANVRRSVLDLLDAIVSERTLLLVVEDVHWADGASWDVLRDLVAWCRGRRVLLVLTTRIAHVPAAALEQLPLRVHHIAPLAADAAARMLDALVVERQRSMSESQRGWLLRAAAGSPLFLRELAIHWLETGREGAVPPSLSALLRDRLARLTPLSLRIFQTCAVMGPTASFERLEQVLEHKRHEVLDGLQELEAAGLLRARGGGVQSRHELLSDEAVAALTESARTYLHRQVALALEPSVLASVPGDASLLWACAEHWRQAGEEGRAWRIAMSCGAYLLEVGLPQEATDVYRAALDYATSAEQIHESRRALASSLIHGGCWEDAHRMLTTIVESEPNTARVTDYRTYETELQLLHADLQMGVSIDAVHAKARLLIANRRVPPRTRAAIAVTAIGLADHACERSALEDTYALVADVLDHPTVQIESREVVRMIYHAASGELDKAWRAAQTLLMHRRSNGTPAELVHALRCAAHVAKRIGERGTAVAYLLDGASESEANRLVTHAIRCCGMLAELHFDALDMSEASGWHARAIGWGRAAQDPLLKAQESTFAAKLALADGRLAEAHRLLSEPTNEVARGSTFSSRMDLLAAKLHLAIAEGSSEPPRNLVAEFDDTFARLIPFGDLDYPAVVRFLLRSREDVQDAVSELSTYITVARRDVGPPSPMVARAIELRASPFESIRSSVETAAVRLH